METQKNIALLDKEFTTILTPASIKAATKSVGAASRDLWQIDPEKLRVIEGFNPRVMNDEYRAHIRSLADSIKSEGFLQEYPLAGYVANVDGESVIYIYSGHTRLLAVRLARSEGAEIPRVPVSINQAGMSIEDMTVALIRGNGGKNLSYYESAVVCKRLVRYGFSVDEIATRTGITSTLVKNRLTIMAQPLRLRELVANEVIAATLALDMVARYGDKALEHIEGAAARAGADGKTRITKAKSGIETQAKYVKKSAPKLFAAASSVRNDPGYAALSDETRELLEQLLADIEGQSKAELTTDPRQMDFVGDGVVEVTV